MLVLNRDRLHHSLGSPFHGFVVDACGVVHCEGHILDSIAVLGMVSRELLMVWIQRSLECKDYLSIRDNVSAPLPLASIKTLS